MKRKKKTSIGQNKRVVVILASLIVLVILSTATILLLLKASERPYKVKTLDFDFKVKDELGFNLDPDKVHFGGGPPGVSLKRTVNLEVDEPSFVKVLVDCDVNISMNSSSFYMEPNETKEVNFELVVPDVPRGTYNGTITFNFYRVEK